MQSVPKSYELAHVSFTYLILICILLLGMGGDWDKEKMKRQNFSTFFLIILHNYVKAYKVCS